MKKFLVYLLVIVLTVSVGFGIFYLVRDNEVISISSASIYKDAGDSFTLDIDHQNKKSYTEITVTSSDDSIVKGEYDSKNGQFKATAVSGGVARINIRTSNSKFRNLWCDVIVGDGTVESPFYISTAEQLASIGMGEETGANTGVFKGSTLFKPEYEKYTSDACYKLVNDIDAASVNNGYWVPLQKFNGRFDGNGLTISNIYIDVEGYKTTLGDKRDVRFDVNAPAGIFASVGKDAVLYNFKVANFSAVGTYSDFGVIAADNYGTIERVEVKDAYCSVTSAVFGGIAGRNVSDEYPIVITNDDGTETQDFERVVARIDRTSVNNLTLGQTTTTDPSGNTVTSVLGVSGTVGGIAGVNNGGRIVYSFVRGSVYFGNSTDVIYGGIVGQNSAIDGLHVDSGDATDTEFEGAGLRDCYADITTYFDGAPSATSNIGGAIGVHSDYQDGLFEEDATKLKVNNYVIGVYYNKEALNLAQQGITKAFGGIGKFLLDNVEVDFVDAETIVFGLTSEDMIKPESFVSHKTKEIQFNEDGTSKGVVETNILWLFDSVWAISADTNDGMPYLNYQLSYIPDDFQTVGTPIVESTMDDYYYEISIDYPVSILSGNEGKVRMRVLEYYQLVYSPTGIEIEFKSSDESIVTVDKTTGKMYGVKAGVASVTATTKSGSQDTVTVIVENIPYKITAPSTLYLYQGEKYSLNNITVSPAPTGNDTITYSIKDTNGEATNIAWIDGTDLCASSTSTGTVKLTIAIADTKLVVDVVVVEIADVTLTASTRNITGYISDMAKTGTITITDDARVDLTYNYNFVTGASIVDIAFDNNDSSRLNYTIKGVGTATLRVGIATVGYEDKGSVDIYFNIMNDETVTLSTSQGNINGYFSSIKKSGSVTVTNSAGTTLAYSATSTNTSVATVTMVGNAMNYTIVGTGTAIATITVTTAHYKGTAYVNFTILDDSNNNGDSITLNTDNISIFVGGNYTLSASGNYSSLTWESTAPSIATVNNQGFVYGVNEGTATIIVKSANAEARCIVYVEKVQTEITSVFVSPSSVTLNKGETYNIKARGNFATVTWSSNDTSIATVSAAGKVTAKATGTAIITASAKDSAGKVRATAICTVTVTAPTVITLAASSTSCYVGDVVTVTATVNKSVTVDWEYDSNLATFSENGNILTITTTKSTTIPVSAKSGTASKVSVSIEVKDRNTYTPYIYNKEQLNAVRNFPNKTYYLAASFSVGDWTPIDNFSGTFTTASSARFTLSDISVSGKEFAGLFGKDFSGNVSNVTIEDSDISGTYAGGIAGKVSGGQVSNCIVESSSITGSTYAGSITGYITSSGVISKCTAEDNTVTATGNISYVGGIVGYASGSSVNSCNVYGGSAKMGSSGHGYAGGAAGYLKSTRVYDCLIGKSGSSVTITAGNDSSDYAGGICGYTDGETNAKTQAVSECTVKYATITGYNAGGIGGSITSSRTVKLEFKEIKSGYRFEDLSSYNFTANINKTAVKDNVTVKGTLAGGLFGVINAGVVRDCYTRATIQGNSSGAVKAGFAARIYASSAFNNNGGSGSCGLVIYCYSACTFSGSGSAYSTTASLVHSYASVGSGSGRAGYCMQYVFDDDKDGSAIYNSGSNLFSKDKVQAKKSSSAMQSSSTYTDKGFSSSTWSISGYPTLKSER